MSGLLTNATNEYDNINVTDGVPEGLIHIAEQFAYVPAKKNNIPYKRAMIGFSKKGRTYYPKFSGLCVEKSLAQPILDYFQKKKDKAAELAEKKQKEKQWGLVRVRILQSIENLRRHKMIDRATFLALKNMMYLIQNDFNTELVLQNPQNTDHLRNLLTLLLKKGNLE